MKKILPLVLLSVGALQCTVSSAQSIGDPYPDARLQMEEGIYLYDQGRYPEAVSKLLSVNRNDSFYVDALYELGLTYMAQKEYGKAAEVSLKGLALESPIKRDLLIQYANALEELGQHDSALKTYDRGIVLYPNNHRFLYEKGVTYNKMKDWNNALKFYEEALQMNVYHPASHFRIGIMAANAKKPALALMALQMYCIVNTSGANVVTALDIMEKISDNEYSTDDPVPGEVFAFANDFNDLDEVILSKGAISAKYKSKVDLNFYIIKQLQVMCEKMPSGISSDDWLLNFYMNFYRKVWSQNMFEGCMLHTFSGINNKDVQKQVKSNQKYIQAFRTWADTYLSDLRDVKTVHMNGKEVKMKHWYQDGDVIAIGNEDSEGNNEGSWVFYNPSGFKSAEGQFIKGKKSGRWTYYHYNGHVKSIETFDDKGVLTGEYKDYYLNGALQESSTFKNDKLQGETRTYNPNNTLASIIQFKDGKSTGVRYNYTFYGYPDNAGELSDGIYNGWYKTFHEDGTIDMDAKKVVNDQVEGEVLYYHPDGSIETKGAFLKGERTGEWVWYYPNKNVQTKGSYDKGKETGIWKFYYDNGTLEKEENYELGRKGVIRYYDRAGKLYGELLLKNNKIDGYKYYQTDGTTVLAEGKPTGGKLTYAGCSEFRNKIIEGSLIAGLEEGMWKYYYENGAFEYEVPFMKGVKNGIMKYYYENGRLKYELNYYNDSREGFYRQFYINGQLQTEGYYRNNMKHGVWKHYYANGQLETAEFFLDGEIQGIDEEYFPDGKKEGEAEYALGFFNNYTQFDTSGNVLHKTGLKFGWGEYDLVSMTKKPIIKAFYKGGIKDSVYHTYYGNGKLHLSKCYERGAEVGEYKGFHPNGKPSVVGYHNEGEQDSLWTYYDENGNVTKRCHYKNDQLNGNYKTYYENGKTEVERTYLDNLRHGRSDYYGPDGTLIFSAQYNGGVLVSYTYPDKNNNLLPPIEVKNETAEIKTFYPNGSPGLSYKLDKGLINGTYHVYYPNGKVYSATNYVNNVLEGESFEYFENGTMKAKEPYFFDDFNGVAVYYHPNGKVAKEINYLYGYKHGNTNYYDVNGKLVKTVKYLYNRIYE